MYQKPFGSNTKIEDTSQANGIKEKVEHRKELLGLTIAAIHRLVNKSFFS